MGDGRCGERVASTPARAPPSLGTLTLPLPGRLPPMSVLAWKMKITQTCEKSSSPSRLCKGMSGLQGGQRWKCCDDFKGLTRLPW